MFLIHWPGVYGLSHHSKDVIKYRHNAWKALTKFHKNGLIRSIGVSNFLIRHLEDLKRECEVVPALNQVEWHPKCKDFDLLQYCKDNGILLQAYSSLGTSSDHTLKKDSTILQIAQKLNKSSSQILLRWANQLDVAIIPKASSRDHLIENMNLNFTIPDAEMELLNNFNRTERIDWDPNDIV
jgi:diketogulonate reductase-like aldo/keto reductase